MLTWLCFGFVSFVLLLDIYLFAKRVNNNQFKCNFLGKTCCNFSYKNIYKNFPIIGATGLWLLAYSYNFEIRKLPATKQHFSRNNNPFSIEPTNAWVKISEKTWIFYVWNLLTTSWQTERNWKIHHNFGMTWSFTLQVHNVLIHWPFFKEGKRMAWIKYGRLILSGEFFQIKFPLYWFYK